MPAEEGGAGKVYMARAGIFNNRDVTLARRPGANRLNYRDK